jgi:cellulose synthase (UDP-forming)
MNPYLGAEWALPLAVAGFCIGVLPFLPVQRTWARCLAIAVGLLVTGRYVFWRFTETTLPADPLTGAGFWVWLVFAFEAVAILNFSITYLMLTRRTDRRTDADRHAARLRALPAAEVPGVDVFICTYNEELQVLERTIIAARHLDYPNFRVWVLDDGRRGWLRDYCKRHRVGYLTRPDNRHAKAGNINHALSVTGAELFAVLDADFAPRRDFLIRTAGFFADPKIGIVQTPHHFFNPDPYQHNLHIGGTSPDEQRLFFDVIQPSRDAWGAAFCCGSASVQRRSAVVGVGGVPTESVTEDILSTLVLLRHGY